MSSSDVPKRPLRVAQVLGNLEFGGVQKLVIELMRGLDRSRFDPILVYFRAPNLFEGEVRERGWLCHKVSVSRSYRPREIRGLARVLAEENVDLVHAHADFACFAARAAALLLPRPIPAVAHYHNQYYHRLDTAFQSRETMLQPYTDRIVVCGEAVGQFVVDTLGVPPDLVCVVKNGVHLEPFEQAGRRRHEARMKYGIPPGTFHIIHTARLEPHKMPQRLLYALAQVKDVSRPWRATFVGGGGEENSLRALLASLVQSDGRTPLAERVVLAGWSNDIPEYLASADLFVHCSKQEGLPLAILESLAAGTPVIASNIPGNREAIVDGESGLLVDMDDPSGVAEVLGRLMGDPALVKRLAEGGRSRAKEFTIERYIQEIEAIYDGVFASPRTKPDPPRGWLGRRRFLRDLRKPVP